MKRKITLSFEFDLSDGRWTWLKQTMESFLHLAGVAEVRWNLGGV